MTIRTLLFTGTIFGCGALLAQPSLTSTNSVGALGTDYNVSTAGFTSGFGTTGAAQSYSFGPAEAVTPLGNRTFFYLDPSVTPSTVFGSTLLVTDGGSDTVFYQVNGNGLQRLGERDAIVGGVLTYTDGPLELKLPLAYGDTWTDNLAATYVVSGYPVTRTGTVVGAADGWGSLALPVSTYDDVLRVKVRRVMDDQNPIAPVHRTFDTYYFFNGILAHPVLKLSIDTVVFGANAPAETRSAQWMGGPGQVGIGELNYNDIQFTAYPNPANAEVNLTFATDRVAKTAEVLNTTGQVVKQVALTSNSGSAMAAAFNVSGLSQGVYQVRVSFSDGTRSTQRLVVR